MGHWLVVAIYTRDDQLVYADLLTVIPWVQWLTWLFQVMPVFFLVGGYVNGLSWQAAQNRQKGYAPWLAHRLQRLILPVLPVLAAWTLISLAWVLLDPNTAQLKIISRVAIVPVWFLVVYILIVLSRSSRLPSLAALQLRLLLDACGRRRAPGTCSPWAPAGGCSAG